MAFGGERVSAATIEIPAVGRPKPLKVPTHAERTLRNGLRVVAVRRPTVPRIEMRLRIPAGTSMDTGDGARATLLPRTILGGTDARDSVEIARALQRLGATLDADADHDDLLVHGGVLTANLGDFLGLTSEILRAASFPADEVAIARDRAAQEIIIQRSQPGALATEALRGRLFGKHRYGRPMPSPEAVRRIGPAPIKRFFDGFVSPRGATLVLVGDLQPARAIDAVEAALRAWKGQGRVERPAPPTVPAPGPVLLVDRPGAVQTTIRVGGPALPRRHPDFFALALAVMVFGGYFSSRLVKNIREDKGYTYSPHTLMDHKRGASSLLVQADVGTEVTAVALHEIRYELGKMAAVPVPQEELDQARRYLAGATSLSIQTQAGYATYVSGLLAAGLDLGFLKSFKRNLEAVTPEQVYAASIRHLAPRRLHTVMVGDASLVRPAVEPFSDVEVRQA